MSEQESDNQAKVVVEAGASPSGMIVADWQAKDKPSTFRKLRWLFAAITLASLAAVSVLLWREWQERFPDLPTGYYLGSINGLDAGGSIYWYLERAPSSKDEVIVAILKEGWEPQRIALTSGSAAGAQALMPLVVGLGDRRLKFVGNAESEQRYTGKVVALADSDKARWSLELVDYSSASLPSAVREEIRLWLLLSNELESVSKKMTSYEKLIPEQREEIERLTAFITEGESLRTKAQDKLRQAEEELESLKEELQRKEVQAKSAAERFEVSQRVTAMGKLVTMGRESLEREERWVNSMLASPASFDDRELEGAYHRAEKVLEIKQLLDEEKAKVKALEAKLGALEQ